MMDGMTGNLTSEALGVIVELGIVYFLAQRFLDARDKRRWHDARKQFVFDLASIEHELCERCKQMREAIESNSEAEAWDALQYSEFGVERAEKVFQMKTSVLDPNMWKSATEYIRALDLFLGGMQGCWRAILKRSDVATKHSLNQAFCYLHAMKKWLRSMGQELEITESDFSNKSWLEQQWATEKQEHERYTGFAVVDDRKGILVQRQSSVPAPQSKPSH
jgi:hypothetical protein